MFTKPCSQLKDRIAKAQNTKEDEAKEDVDGWKAELKHLQDLIPLDNQVSGLRDKELPELEKQLKEEKARLPELVSQHDKVSLLVNKAAAIQI